MYKIFEKLVSDNQNKITTKNLQSIYYSKSKSSDKNSIKKIKLIMPSGIGDIDTFNEFDHIPLPSSPPRNLYYERDLRISNFNKLKEINSEIIGWINIPNTNIDYPILKTTNNSYYLQYNYYKEYSFSGSIFMDFRNDSSLKDSNTIIYGHNMGSNDMFAQLTKYKDKNFFKNNTTIYIDLEGFRYYYKIFSAYTTDSYQENIPYKFDEIKFIDYLNLIKSKSIFSNEDEIVEDDNIISLVTCDYNFTNARLVLHARLISFEVKQ